jgi:hypothetical protein
VRADSDQRIRSQDAPRLFHRHVVLTEMDAVRLDQPGDVGPVVDDEQGARLPCPAAHVARQCQQLAVAPALLTQLEDRRSTRRRLLDGPVERGGTAGACQQDVQARVGQPLPGVGAGENGAL